jgi:hypothetical protein
MFNNPSKYYKKYNRNIIGIKGSGEITQREPKDTNKRTDTIKEILVDDIDYAPPLFLRTWDNDPQNTNGYLNDKNYINYVPELNKYYYAGQEINKLDIIKNIKNKNIKIVDNPISLPPPLVTTSPIINKKKIKKEKLLINNSSEFGIDESDVNKNWYDGRYLYTFSPASLNTIYPWTNYNLLYPYNNVKNTLDFNKDSNILKITGNPLLRQNQIENFNNVPDTQCIVNHNMLYLTILIILIIIYFIRSRK